MEREEVQQVCRELNQLLESRSADKDMEQEAKNLRKNRPVRKTHMPQEEPSPRSSRPVRRHPHPEVQEEVPMKTQEPEPVPAPEPPKVYVPEPPGPVGPRRAKRDKERYELKLLKATDSYLAAFFVPVVIMIIIFAQRGIFPFGEESFLRTDMYHQYAPFFSEFQYKLTHGGSLLYSWDIGMGVNFSALYAYYLASPVNWLLIFCPKAYIIEFMTLWIVLKIGFSGLSFAWYLQKHCRTRDFTAGLFGIFYALSGYMAAYSWNIMWLDCILLFPVVMLGLERLVKENKPILYCVSLGLCILSNYYISIMICIFMVIYFFAQLILNPPKSFGGFVGTGLRFAVSSLAAGGLAAVVLLPEIYVLQSTASGDVSFPQTLSCYFSIFDMIARHIPNVQTETGLEHWPNIYCGAAVFLFLPLYLMCSRIRRKEKVVYVVLLGFFYASFSINVLNFIWHGFHYPNSLPCRQSFIYIALVLLMCYRACMYLDRIPWKQAAASLWIGIGFIILAEKLVDNTQQFHFMVFYGALIYLALYGLLIYLYKNRKKSADFVLLGALALTALESAVNTTVTSVPTTSRTAYIQDNEDVHTLTAQIPADTFYRIEKVDRKTKNDGAWMNFPSVSLFSSTANASLSEFFRQVGCESSTNAYSITGSTPLIDSLFSVKYGLYSQQLTRDDGYRTYVSRSGDTWLYENQYTLPIAFMLPDGVEENWILNSGNPAWVQNDLCKILGVSQVLALSDSYQYGDGIAFVPEQDGEYYAFVTSSTESVTVVGGSRTCVYENLDRGYLIELGTCSAGEEVRLSPTDDNGLELNAEIYRFSLQGLKEVYEKMNQNPMTVTRWTDVDIEGVIQADFAGVMFTSIPYDKGWKVLVDGSPAETREVFGTFLGIDLPVGEHTVQMSYEPQGLKIGAVISGVSALFVAGAAGTYYYLDKKKKKEEG